MQSTRGRSATRPPAAESPVYGERSRRSALRAVGRITRDGLGRSPLLSVPMLSTALPIWGGVAERPHSCPFSQLRKRASAYKYPPHLPTPTDAIMMTISRITEVDARTSPAQPRDSQAFADLGLNARLSSSPRA